jgi:flagellar FliL protein
MAASDGSDADGGHGGGGGGHGGGGSEEAAAPITIDNLILNPADSNGSRFLIATLVLDADERARVELEARDAEARDLLLTVLAIRTVDELANIGLREEIREDLRAALNTMLGRDAVHRIFLPQFVIQ